MSWPIQAGPGIFSVSYTHLEVYKRQILYRPKMGFAVPLARWFRGPLKDRVRQAVLGSRLAETGWFNREYLQHLVDAHQSGARDYSAPLWTLLMFEAFLRNVLDESTPIQTTQATLANSSSVLQ